MAEQMTNVVVYTRGGCHLCDDAIALLKRYDLSPDIVDIDRDPSLHELYDQCVPVVAINGKVRFRGKVNEILLSRLVKH